MYSYNRRAGELLVSSDSKIKWSMRRLSELTSNLGVGCHLELTPDGKGQIDGRLQVTRLEWSRGHNLSG